MAVRVVELFAGIGSQAMALKDAGIPHILAGMSEIDSHAIASYGAIHGNVPQLGDVTALEHLPACELLTYSFPCQDLSLANSYRRGMARGSGTRSALLWEVGRLLEDAVARGQAPEHLVMENVPAVLQKANAPAFHEWVSVLENLGYESDWAVLNAMMFDVPQHRRRLFMVSNRSHKRFRFPTGTPTSKRLKDVLEENVPESYYMSADKVSRYEEHRCRHEDAGHGLGWQPRTCDDIGRTVTCNPTRHGGNFIVEPAIDVVGNLNDPSLNDLSNRVYGMDGVSPCITTRMDNTRGCKISDGDRVRMLTPLECWRLMGFPDWAYERAKGAGTSAAQLYKQAGNAIAVPVLTAIFNAMYGDGWEPRRNLADWE